MPELQGSAVLSLIAHRLLVIPLGRGTCVCQTTYAANTHRCAREAHESRWGYSANMTSDLSRAALDLLESSAVATLPRSSLTAGHT